MKFCLNADTALTRKGCNRASNLFLSINYLTPDFLMLKNSLLVVALGLALCACDAPTTSGSAGSEPTTTTISFKATYPEAARAFEQICAPMLAERGPERALARLRNQGFKLVATGGRFDAPVGRFFKTPRYQRPGSEVQVTLATTDVRYGALYNKVSGAHLCAVSMSTDYVDLSNPKGLRTSAAVFVDAYARAFAKQKGYNLLSDKNIFSGKETATGSRHIYGQKGSGGVDDSYVGAQGFPPALMVATNF